MSNNGYLASDLVDVLEMPRSTINDWLGEYADFLATEMRGKRRVYPEKSLAILKEVKEWRNQKLSYPEIREKLAQKYGIAPEIHHDRTDAGSAPEQAPAETGSDEARQHLPEVKFNDYLGNFLARLESVEAERRAAEGKRRKQITLAAIAVGLLLLIALAGLLLTLQRLDRQTQTLQNDRGTLTDALQASQAEIAKMNATLDQSRGDFAKNIQQLQSNLAVQREEFERQLKMLEQNSAQAKELERIKLKEEFARTQKAQLEALAKEYDTKLQTVDGDRQAAIKKAQQLEQQTAALKQTSQKEQAISRKELEELKQKIADLERNKAKSEEQTTKPTENKETPL